MFDWFNKDPRVVKTCTSAIGCDTADLSQLTKQTRSILGTVLGTSDLGPVTGSCANNLRPGILSAWRIAASDPDDQPEKWWREGAPAGIRMHVEDRGIFPLHDKDDLNAPVDCESLSTDLDSFFNYANAEEDDDAWEELMRFANAGCLKVLNTWKETTDFLDGETPVLNKLNVISKERNGKIKKRIIMDAKQSDVTAATARYERTLLPRTLDAVHDCLDLLAQPQWAKTTDNDTELFVADFKDAFWSIPNHPRERRFCVMHLRGKYLVYLRTPQGSRNAPLTWGRSIALVARLTQGAVPIKQGRLNVYVDDPLAALRGPRDLRDKLISMILLLWSSLGFTIAMAKAKRGTTLEWVQAEYKLFQSYVVASIKEGTINDVMKMTKDIRSLNVVPTKMLRTYVGKCASIASLVTHWRPFLAELWGALSTEVTNAPTHCIWTKHISSALLWIEAFLSGRQPGALRKVFQLHVHLGQGKQVDICLDASPWGLGGYLCINGVITEYFASEILPVEANILDGTIGQASIQQVAESLAALVALRLWSSTWMSERCHVRVRSDSIAALTMTLKLKTSGKGCTLIAREMALDISEAVYCPHISEHVPGIANVTCDVLSRKFQPKASFHIPACLVEAKECTLPPRSREYFRTLDAHRAADGFKRMCISHPPSIPISLVTVWSNTKGG